MIMPENFNKNLKFGAKDGAQTPPPPPPPPKKKKKKKKK